MNFKATTEKKIPTTPPTTNPMQKFVMSRAGRRRDLLVDVPRGDTYANHSQQNTAHNCDTHGHLRSCYTRTHDLRDPEVYFGISKPWNTGSKGPHKGHLRSLSCG